MATVSSVALQGCHIPNVEELAYNSAFFLSVFSCTLHLAQQNPPDNLQNCPDGLSGLLRVVCEAITCNQGCRAGKANIKRKHQTGNPQVIRKLLLQNIAACCLSFTYGNVKAIVWGEQKVRTLLKKYSFFSLLAEYFKSTVKIIKL